MPRLPTGPRPPALTHGLTSRTARAAFTAEREALAAALRRHAPPDPPVLLAAIDAAEATLHHRHIYEAIMQLREAHARSSGLEKLAFARDIPDLAPECFADPEVGGALYVLWRISVGIDPLWDGTENPGRDCVMDLVAAFAHPPEGLRGLEDYERKAFSRRTKLLRRLDYERIEAERRRAGRK